MALANGLVRGALHTRFSGLLFPGTSSAIMRQVSTSGPVKSAESDSLAPSEKEEKRLAIIGAVQENVVPLSGVPELHVKHRKVRIFIPAKNAMQSGTNACHKWRLEFDTWERWSNPLMGWSSTGDPLSNTIVEFSELEDAIAYCEKNQWNFEVEQPQTLRRLSKSYGANYAWNKRTRTSAK